MLAPPLALDFDERPAPPDWLVDGLIEKETVTVMSADSGVGKSIICKALTVAMLQGKPWLGRGVHGDRVVVVDQENVARVVKRRLQAFGMTNADRDRLRYFCRIGVTLGEGDWFDRTEQTLQAFGPDLLIIDTAAAATAVDVNDNTAVARFYSNVLRPFAFYCAVILLHHERKPPAQGAAKRNAAHAMMGARQWAGQADAHIALEAVGVLSEEEQEDGSFRQRYPLKMEMPKSRDGASARATTHFSVVSEKEPDGETLRWMRLDLDEAPDQRRAEFMETKQRAWRDKVLRIIGEAGGKMQLADLASKLGASADNGALKRGLRAMESDEELARPAHGEYALPDPQEPIF